MSKSSGLRFGALDHRTVHLCIAIQNLFAENTPWMRRVLPIIERLAARHPERTVFTRFIPARHPDELPGAWRRYYRKWTELTLERIEPRLGADGPPAAVIVRQQTRSLDR